MKGRLALAGCDHTDLTVNTVNSSVSSSSTRGPA